MQTLLKSNKKCKFIGIYYDDPDKIARNKLRHIVGAVLGNPDNGPIDKESQAILEKHGYKTITLPKISTAVLSRFPTFTGLSMLLAVNYVYPLAKEFVEVKHRRNFIHTTDILPLMIIICIKKEK